MKYTIKINTTSDGWWISTDASIVGLLEKLNFGHLAWGLLEKLNFGHLAWNVDKYGTPIGGPVFEGGVGGSYSTWHEAILASLRDLYETHNDLKAGDELEATYMGQTALYRCEDQVVLVSISEKQ